MKKLTPIQILLLVAAGVGFICFISGLLLTLLMGFKETDDITIDHRKLRVMADAYS